MSEKDAVARMVKRMLKDKLRRTGQTPDAKDTRVIERRAQKIAQETDNMKKRR